MKRIYILFTVLATVAAAFSSCVKESAGKFDDFTGEGIVLKLETGSLDMATKADSTRPGNDDGDFNENDLGTAVDVFFFPEHATDATASLKSLSVSVRTGGYVQIPVSMGDIYTIFGGTVSGSKSDIYVIANYNGSTAIDHSHHYTLGEIKALKLAKADWSTFPQQNFVMTGSTTITLGDASSNTPASGTVQMRRIAAKLTFKLTVADEIVVENITRDHEGNIASKSLDKWHPIPAAMTVYLQYGMNYALVGGNPQMVPAAPKGAGAADSLYTYKANKLELTEETKTRHRTIIDRLEHDEETDEWTLVTHDANVDVPVYKTMYMQYSGDAGTLTDMDGPFYSYPVTWDPGVQTEPFLKLIIPWNNGSRTKYYYYKVPFSGTSLEANNWYEITLDVQVLGGEDELPVPLECRYKVVDWVPGAYTEGKTVAARYLSVPKTEWIMYNTPELVIPITSSHDVQIVGYEVKSGGTSVNNAFAAADKYTNGQPRAAAWIGSNPSIYNPFTDTRFTIDEETPVGTVYATSVNYNQTGMNGAPYPNNISTAASWFPTAEITRDQIVMRHNLDNDTDGTTYDIAPYYVRIRVQHKDETANYYKDIIIEQRPAIMIDAEFNSGGTSSTGYVYVNNSQPYTNGGAVYLSRSGYYNYTYSETIGSTGQSNSSGNNTNDYMYVIETSVLPADSDYVLGDPRSLTVDNLASVNGSTINNWSASANYVGGGTSTRRLSNYYPAIMTEDGNNIIAPKFRIASSHGKTIVVTYENAVRRCASYQEDGYPAGRWRLPTEAECKYIAKLNTDKKIPRLLGDSGDGTTDYWCNSGYVTVYNGTSTTPPVYSSGKTGSRYVRCVYDEWFWENTQYETVTKNTFTWGDQTRASVVRTKAAVN